ncbi:hypothetical protein EMIHUDRAFT_241213 [Emiliania huxleyi CCMP1516]|uniref:Fe2OG dioxygenase domain-containing protein n=2 Tax=Emiliania huxleyi TaxID=2903 RepID=A0A0D3JD62_EMIH1|nr:hypothetical protein EMIHUDRAFT_241213 [Emiliania huxleyi CCMP1516]EOD21447.1 hypothetical protein EMIHUDRAFT_241213 [Emiliania huxleyi CCMP1516]|eukprot:XP_005773876.1 hypothetical protein EMIHUDRAFT_241213 [Emiliania huxleyi CCMP1516]
MLRSVWSAPHVAAAAASLHRGRIEYQRGRHFELLAREPGSERPDLPIWVSSPHAIEYEPAAGPVVKHEVPGVRGAFVLSNVLSLRESEQLLRMSEAMGYTEDAPVSLGRRIRRNSNCVWIADDSVWLPVWRRIAPHLPPEAGGGRPAGLNQRWRLYRYGESDVFRLHTDGSWPGSAAGDGRVTRDAYGDRWSQMTLLLYLDDDYDGGETSFVVSEEGLPASAHAPGARVRSVRVARGSALLFYHGEHPLSMLHEGSLVSRGVKTIVRSDVLYTLLGRTLPDGDSAALPLEQPPRDELR